jgi:hypothetical protein
MPDQRFTIHQTIASDVVRDTGSHDLLRPATPDTQQSLDRSPVDERAGKRQQGVNNGVQMGIPGRFGGHGVFSMLVRTCALYKRIEKTDK